MTPMGGLPGPGFPIYRRAPASAGCAGWSRCRGVRGTGTRTMNSTGGPGRRTAAET